MISLRSCLILIIAFALTGCGTKSANTTSTANDSVANAESKALVNSKGDSVSKPGNPTGETTKSLNEENGEIILEGFIGDHFEIFVLLKRVSENQFEGKYLYKRVQQFIPLKGKIENNTLVLTEYDTKGAATGKFEANVASYPTLTGKWTKPDGSGELTLYLQKIQPFGLIPAPGKFEFVSLKQIKTGKNSSVEITNYKPDSAQNRLNALLAPGPAMEGETVIGSFNVLYNLNGILTIAFNQENEGGWQTVHYTCINVKNRRSLRFEDIFKPESKKQIAELMVKKVKEDCPMVDDYTVDQINFTDNPPMVTRAGIIFISPCPRQAGYLQGDLTLYFSFEEMRPFLKTP